MLEPNLSIVNPYSINNIGVIPKKKTNLSSANQEYKKTSVEKIAVGAGLMALASFGIYLATKGKAKKIVDPNIMEKTLPNGNKVVIKNCAFLTKDGLIPAKKISVYDKTGKIIKEKSKAITKSVNDATGKKYTMIRQGFYQNGNYMGMNEVNRYYSKDGKLLLKVNKSTDNRGFKVITKQAPVSEYVLKGEKEGLVSNALNFNSLAGTSAMAQSQRTNGMFRHQIATTAADAKNTIKLAQEKGFAPRCGELKLEKL